MSSIFQFMGGARATKSIVNYFSSSGWTPVQAQVPGGRSISSGALTAGTLKTLLSVAGAGVLNGAALTTIDSAARTIRLRVTVDGTVVFDSTSASSSATSAGCLVGAGTTTSGQPIAGSPIRFMTSLVVEVASSLTETDKLQLSYMLTGE